MDNDKALVTLNKINSEIKVAQILQTDVRGVIDEECRKAGLSSGDLYDCLKNGLKAKKVTLDKFCQRHEEEDYATQHKFMVTGLELIGHLKHAEAMGEGVMDRRIAEQILIEVRNVVINNTTVVKTKKVKDG